MNKPLVLAELCPPLNAALITNSSGLSQVRDFFNRVDTFGFDCETNIVQDFSQRKVRTIQVGNRDEQYVLDLLHFAGSTEELLKQGSCVAPGWAKEVVYTLSLGLESGKHCKAGVNLEFDYEAVKWGFGLRPWNFYDCMLVEKLLLCGRVNLFAKDTFAMDDMLRKYAGIDIDKSLQKSFDLESPLTEDQIAYAALDTRFPLAIRGAQTAHVQRAKLERVVRLENAAIPAFGDMHLNGFFMDREDWMKNVAANKIKHDANVQILDKYFVPVVGDRSKPDVDLDAYEKKWKDEKDKLVRAEYRKEFMVARKKLSTWNKDKDKWEGEAAISYSSTPQMLAGLRKMGFDEKKLESTNDKVLKTLAQESIKTPVEECKNPVIRALQNYRETLKKCTGYGAEFPDKYINPNTGRVHARINQIGADTGRCSSSNPNGQNLDPISRKCFKARPGYKLVIADMSGAELRIMAELSGEQSWLTAFEKDWDVHSMNAELMYKDRWYAATEEGCAYAASHKKCNCKGHKALRQIAKILGFKTAYGGADLSDDLNITKKESNEILALWTKANPVLNDYLQQSGKSASMSLESRSMSGRRRLYDKPDWNKAKELAIERFEEEGKNPLNITSRDINRAYSSMLSRIERQGKNTPIQAGNVDILKQAISVEDGYLWQQLEPKYGAYMLTVVHDEVVIETPDEHAEAVSELVRECFRKAGAEFMSKVVMESESVVSDIWSKE